MPMRRAAGRSSDGRTRARPRPSGCGGGAAAEGHGANAVMPGGSGTVIVNEPEVDFVEGTSSCWDLRTVYREVKSGSWTN